MSSDNFIPSFWMATVMLEKQKAAVYTSPQVSNRNFEGVIADAGDSVKINQIGPVTVNDYTKNTSTLTYEILDSASVNLLIDQSKSFSFRVDNVDKAQANVDLVGAGMADAGYRLNDTADQYVAAKGVAEAGVKSGLGTAATPLEINSSNVVDFCGDVQAALLDANNPFSNWFMIIPPQLYKKFVKASVLDIRSTTLQERVTSSGLVGNVLNFNIFVSNNVPAVSTTPASAKYKILAGSTDAITYAEQLVLMEALRLQDKIGDGVRGLHVYGAKVVRPTSLARAIVNVAAEA